MKTLLHHSRIKALIMSICGILFISEAWAVEVAGVRFNEFYQDQGIRMSLQGTGLKSMLFFKAFVAGYYSNFAQTADLLGEFPKRIEVEYFVHIPGRKLSNYTIEQMKVNVSSDDFKKLSSQIRMMEKYFVDLKPKDRFALTYIPGVGTKFTHNGKLTGIIEGEDFARALFAVWIGDRPFDPVLKEQIAGLTKKAGKLTERVNDEGV